MRIAVLFVALALAVAVVHIARYARLPGKDQDRERLECEGLCEGATAHEPDGDGTATCSTCGTPRAVPTSAA